MGSFHHWFDRDKLKEIFRIHWEFFKEKFSRYRAARYDEVVKKMPGCGDPKNGYTTYVCSYCGGDRKRFLFHVRVVFVYLVLKFIQINGQLV